MSFDGTDPCWVPDIPVSMTKEWRLREASFGDGYAQRTLDGINALNVKWSVTFENREAAVVNAMTAFLEAEKATSFLYKDQMTGITYRVFCDSWQIDWNLRRKPKGQAAVYYGTLSAEFRKANGVGI